MSIVRKAIFQNPGGRMSVQGISQVTIEVGNIYPWAWFYIDVLGGRLTGRSDLGVYRRWRIAFHQFDVVLTQSTDAANKKWLKTHGDSAVSHIVLVVENLTEFQNLLAKNGKSLIAMNILILGNWWAVVTDRKRPPRDNRGWLKKVDHITIPTKRPEIFEEFFCGVLQGRKSDLGDVDPESKKSSMRLTTVSFENCGFAFPFGINRARESQVSAFLGHHGEGMIQHVAYDVGDLPAFCRHAEKTGVQFLDKTIFSREEKGEIVNQIFGCGYDNEFPDPAVRCFPEFLDRLPKGKKKQRRGALPMTFSRAFARDSYGYIEAARARGERRTIIDFSRMPQDWDPGCPVKEK